MPEYAPPLTRATGAVFPYTHPIPSSQGVSCGMCGQPASHKVAEVTDDERHELTSYVCCSCFGRIMGALAVRLCARANQGSIIQEEPI